MKRTIIRLFIIVGLLSFAPCVSFAQSASDSYNQGVALMNKGDYSGAIASFKASMVINKSAANKKKCNSMIARCNRLARAGRNNTESPKPATKSLELSTHNLEYEYNEDNIKVVMITTRPESDDWTATVDDSVKEWCRLSKSMDGKELNVSCLPFNNTIARSTNINVIYGDRRDNVKVVQKGKEVVLETNPFVNINKRKGGQQVIVINCNSDTVYADKRNWELVRTPVWCEVMPAGDKQLTVKADKLNKTDAEFKTGRTGDIVIRSQNKEIIIRVDQK